MIASTSGMGPISGCGEICSAPVPELSPVPKVSALLNGHGAQYVIIGAEAAILHGYVRDTHDVDILVPDDEENHGRIIAALSGAGGSRRGGAGVVRPER